MMEMNSSGSNLEITSLAAGFFAKLLTQEAALSTASMRLTGQRRGFAAVVGGSCISPMGHR